MVARVSAYTCLQKHTARYICTVEGDQCSWIHRSVCLNHSEREPAAMSKSEVARLREQIELELEAMQRGMRGLAITARHDFILARLDRVGTYQDKLADQIGYTEATEIVCQLYVQVMEKDMVPSGIISPPSSA